MVDPSVIGPATLAVSQGVSAFTTFLPKISDVRKVDPANNPDVAADVRMGEVAAVALTVGIGAIASGLTGSNVPVLTSLVVSAALVLIYESTLRADKPFEPKDA